jgi:hypothetical protein
MPAMSYLAPSIPSSTFFDVKRAIRLIKSNVVGRDGNYFKLVNLILLLILSPLAHLLNESMVSKTFPTAWKRSKIVPVAKVKRSRLAKRLSPY